jgi:predicted ATP-dependent endonuclease of OLD family
MKIISGVKIEGFRSIASESLDNLGDHTIVIGKNSSGKSNVLRALNLFFNNEPSPGNPLDFNRDLHYRPTRKQKKEIRIEIRFDLPEKFNFRSGLERIKDLGSCFSVRKVWELDRIKNVKVQTDILIDGIVQGVDSQMARDFLSLIVFRYIPKDGLIN